MDPICHTLVGAALGEAGLKRRTPQAVPTLLIGANLPDIDVLSYFWGPVAPLAFRRGWTHGLGAVLVLPLVLAAGVAACDGAGRWWARRRGRPPALPADVRQLALVAFLAVLTHPLLDFLNTYGVRWLMPFSDTWYYGDTLFIVDPVVWLVLGAGLVLSRRAGRPGSRRPAALALAVVALYIGFMGASSWLARRVVARQLSAHGIGYAGLMVAPVVLNPFRKDVLIERDGVYELGTFRWLPRPRFTARGRPRAIHGSESAARAAARTPEGRLFLTWSRFPYYLISETAGGYDVRILDARYNADWASVAVRLGAETMKKEGGNDLPMIPAAVGSSSATPWR